MKAIVICIIVTLLVVCFARPQHIAEMFNPTNRLTVEQAQDCYRALTGQYPHGVPVLVVGSSYEAATQELEGDLQKRGVAFTAIEITSNPQARIVLNKIGKQAVPTTIVGTSVVEGCKPDEVEQALLAEQKSLKWPVNDGNAGGPGRAGGAGGAGGRHGGAPGKSSRHGHGHQPARTKGAGS